VTTIGASLISFKEKAHLASSEPWFMLSVDAVLKGGICINLLFTAIVKEERPDNPGAHHRNSVGKS
jgi:hypothetical protein